MLEHDEPYIHFEGFDNVNLLVNFDHKKHIEIDQSSYLFLGTQKMTFFEN